MDPQEICKKDEELHLALWPDVGLFPKHEIIGRRWELDPEGEAVLLPHYYDDGNVMLELIDKMNERGWTVHFIGQVDGLWVVEFQQGPRFRAARNESLKAAVADAAFKALDGKKVEL